MTTVSAGDLQVGPGQPPRIVGVLNVSERSPYDPSVHTDPASAAEHAVHLARAGADVIDVGLESANRRYETLSAAEERDRLEIALDVVDRVQADVAFSIETRYAEVAAAALDGGFTMVNDICGFADPEMAAVCRERSAAVVKMAGPDDLDRPGVVEAIDWESERSPAWVADADHVDRTYAALERGPLTDQTIVDPAFGRWSDDQTLEQDRTLLDRLGEFRALDRPILVSLHRKSFLRTLCDRSTEEALPVSLAATALAVARGADLVRTHDVEATADAARIGAAFSGTPAADLDREIRERTIDSIRAAERECRRVGAESDRADEMVARTVDIAVDEQARERLAAAAPEAGVTVAAGPDGTLLSGSPAAFERLADAVDAPADLADDLAWLADALGTDPTAVMDRVPVE
ncbi:MAG: dihydropteroate synthase [Halococcoides sp.]